MRIIKTSYERVGGVLQGVMQILFYLGPTGEVTLDEGTSEHPGLAGEVEKVLVELFNKLVKVEEVTIVDDTDFATEGGRTASGRFRLDEPTLVVYGEARGTFTAKRRGHVWAADNVALKPGNLDIHTDTVKRAILLAILDKEKAEARVNKSA